MTKTSKNSANRRRLVVSDAKPNGNGSHETISPMANVGIGSEAVTKSLKKMRRRYGTTLKRLAK